MGSNPPKLLKEHQQLYMERKYGSRGYMDSYRDGEQAPKKAREKPKGAPRRMPKDVHRTINMPGFTEVLRCGMCGVIVENAGSIQVESQCPKCQSDLRTCKNCRYFDTGAQFECTKPVPERVTPKDLRNSCTFFEAKTSVERETRDSPSSGSSQPKPAAPSRPSDARSAFEALFKK